MCLKYSYLKDFHIEKEFLVVLRSLCTEFHFWYINLGQKHVEICDDIFYETKNFIEKGHYQDCEVKHSKIRKW